MRVSNRLFMLLVSCAPSATADDPYFRGLNPNIGEIGSVALGISADGRTVVGYVQVDLSTTHACYWRDGEFGILTGPNGPARGEARAVSANGWIIVGNAVNAMTRRDGGVWDNLSYSTLNSGGLEEVTVEDVSGDGLTIVGWEISGSFPGPLRWINRQLVPTRYPATVNSMSLHAVNDDGRVIVGIGQIPGVGSRAVKWDARQYCLGDLNGDRQVDVNDLSRIITQFGSDVPENPADLDSDGDVDLSDLTLLLPRFGVECGWTILDDLYTPPSSTAWAVSGNGSVTVGESRFDSGGSNTATKWDGAEVTRLWAGNLARAVSHDGSVIVGHEPIFLWTEHDGPRWLPEVLANEFGLDVAGWDMDSATGVSADGQTIVGHGTNPSGQQEAFIAHIHVRCSRTDLTYDHQTDLSDLTLLLSHFGECIADANYWPVADIDERGCVDLPDLTLLLAEFGSTCQ